MRQQPVLPHGDELGPGRAVDPLHARQGLTEHVVADRDGVDVGADGRDRARRSRCRAPAASGPRMPEPMSRSTAGRPVTTCHTSGCTEAAWTRTSTSSASSSGRGTSTQRRLRRRPVAVLHDGSHARDASPRGPTGVGNPIFGRHPELEAVSAGEEAEADGEEEGEDQGEGDHHQAPLGPTDWSDLHWDSCRRSWHR